VWDLDRCQLLRNDAVLGGARVHGVHCPPWRNVLAEPASAPGDGLPSEDYLLVVCGGRCVKLLRLQLSRAAQGVHVQLEPVHDLGPQQQWAHVAQAVTRGEELEASSQPDSDAADQQPAQSAYVVLGLMDNSVEVWRVPLSVSGRAVCIARVESSTRLLLYAMTISLSLLPAGDAQQVAVRVASGTIFHDVLLWRLRVTLAASAGALHESVAPEHRLQGHVGSVMKVQFAAGGRLLLSTADDRTARVWRVDDAFWRSEEAPPHVTPCEQAPLLSLWGHTARVWDVALVGRCGLLGVQGLLLHTGTTAPERRLLVTASEDCTCRVWHAHSGEELAKVPAHQGRGVWCCAVMPGGYLLSGGADAAVRLWHLPEWLQPQHRAALKQTVNPAAVGSGPAHSEQSRDAPSVAAHVVTLSLAPPLRWLPQPRKDKCSGAPDDVLHPRGADSAEFTRAVVLVAPQALVSVTKRGHVHLASWPPSTAGGTTTVTWTSLYERCGEGAAATAAVTCLDALRHPAVLPGEPARAPQLDVVACGDIAGGLVLLAHAVGALPPATPLTPAASWAPFGGAPVLGVHLLRGLPLGHVLTAGADNCLLWWFAPALAVACPAPSDACDPVLLACMTLPWAQRLAAVDALPQHGLLVTGDQRGGIAAFAFPPQLLVACTADLAAVRALADDSAAALTLPLVFRLGSCHNNTQALHLRTQRGCVTSAGRNGEGLRQRG